MHYRITTAHYVLGTAAAIALIGTLAYAMWLPAELRDRVAKVLATHEAAQNEVQARRTSFQNTLKRAPLPNLPKLAKRRKLAADFDKADEALKHAEHVCGQLARAEGAFFPTRNAVQEHLAPCARHVSSAQVASKRPGLIVKRWVDMHARMKDLTATLARDIKTAQKDLDAALASDSPTLLALRARQATYPHRATDLDGRIEDLRDLIAHIHDEHKRFTDEAARLRSGDPDADIDRFTHLYDTLAGRPPRNGLLDVLELATEDLDARLEQLDTHEATHVSRLIQTPAFYVQLVTYCWSNSDYDDTSVCSTKTIELTEDVFNRYTLNKTVRTTGSNSGSGSETVVEDREIRYTYAARIAEASGGPPGKPQKVDLDEATFFDYYEGALALQRLLPESGAVVKDRSRGRKIEGVPLYVDMDVNLVVDHKPRGTYEDEAAEAPAPAYTPLHLVDHPEFGAWTPDAGGPVWTWHEDVRAQWGIFNAEYAPYYARLTRAQWDAYNAWRVAQTYDRTLVDRSGRPVERDTSKRRRGKRRGDIAVYYYDAFNDEGSAVRGAGARARSRGMGGGGK